MQQVQNSWLGELDAVPIGNQKNDSIWETAMKDHSKIVDDAERKLQEEKKFKLRKAMADSTLIDELPQVSFREPGKIILHAQWLSSYCFFSIYRAAPAAAKKS
jgi:hypothetical protein